MTNTNYNVPGGIYSSVIDTQQLITIKKLPLNEKGKDYFVGDIHGCYNLLMQSLEWIGFRPEIDRLISVGDLGDRGPDSFSCFKLVEQPWFHAVKGNHEDMLVGVLSGGWPTHNFIANGGEWLFKLDLKQQYKAGSLAASLPLAIEVPIKYNDEVCLLGVVHADCLVDSWNNLSTKATEEHLLWGRTRIGYKMESDIKDVEAVVVGHTVVKKPVKYGNVVYIDTGAVFEGDLTILTGQEIIDFRRGVSK